MAVMSAASQAAGYDGSHRRGRDVLSRGLPLPTVSRSRRAEPIAEIVPNTQPIPAFSSSLAGGHRAPRGARCDSARSPASHSSISFRDFKLR